MERRALRMRGRRRCCPPAQIWALGPHLGLGGPACLRLRRLLEMAAAMMLVQGTAALRPACCSGTTRALRVCLGPAGPGGPGLLLLFCPVDYRLSVVEVVPSRVAAMLLSLAPAMSSPPSCRPRASVHEETMMMTAQSGWRLLVGGEEGGGAPLRAGFLWVGLRRNLCRLVRLRRDAAFEWRHSLLEGVRVASSHSTPSAGGNPRTSWSGQRRVLTVTS